MTLIDQYISDHKHEMSVVQLADRIGVKQEFVYDRLKKLEVSRIDSDFSLTIQQEMHALVNFIDIRKTGCMVDIAKQRLKDLNDKINKS